MDLNMSYDVGGMNEAFSDMAGEAAEDFVGSPDWMTGFEIFQEEDKALR